MADAKDLSKIDFSKCKLPKWSSRWFAADFHVGRVVLTFCGKTVASKNDDDWVVTGANGERLSSIEALRPFCSIVDIFIASELARIAAKEEAENWVPVLWQDAEWLTGQGCNVQFRNIDLGYDWGPRNGEANHLNEYRADRRAFPAGYDPDKPRWVEVDDADYDRLRALGCSGEAKLLMVNPPKSEYEIDVHTLPPGVPLHVEPEKPSPRWRDCSREFAMSHKKTSSYRVRVDDGHQWSWSGWAPMACHDGSTNHNGEEFQTTEPEEKPQSEPIRHTPDAFMRRLIDCAGTSIFARTPRSPFAQGRWFLFETLAGFKSGAAKDSCSVNLDMHLFFAQEWFEVEA